MSNIAEIVAINRNRERIYIFLSRIYQIELTRELIEKMRTSDGPLVDTSSLEGMTDSDVQEGFVLLTRAVSAMKGKKVDDVWTELASDFAGVFLGVRHDILSHPSES